MKFIISILTLLFSIPAFSSECVEDLMQKHRDDGVEEIKDFEDLNGDGILEKLVLLRGSMKARYGVVYLEAKPGCFTEIYGGSENVGTGTAPESFHGTNRIEKDEFNGFKLLRDSSWDAKNITIQLYAYDKEQNQYKLIYSTTEYGWFK